MSEKLKPCPFCGEVDILGEITETDFKEIPINIARIFCSGCGVEIRRGDLQKCIDAWNRRVGDEH